MKKSYSILSKVILVFVILAGFAARVNAQTSLAPRVLVVYDPANANSVSVANHYVASRGIPNANLCPVTPLETLTRLTWAQYVSSIKTPIQNCLTTVGPNQILYIVLSYIRPFTIVGQNGLIYGLDHYVADIWDQYSSVDAYPYPVQTQPYFAANQAQGNAYQPYQSFADYRAQSGALQIYSVWRLDAATPALAQGLVDKALAAESQGLSGQACFDRIYGNINNVSDFSYGMHDWDLHMAAIFTAQAGFTVTEDQNTQEFGTLPAPNCPGAAMYAGWYSFSHYNDAFTWNTGAIGFHLDSASAVDPRGGTNWSANAIIKGITVTSGVVSEPFVQGLPHPDGVYLDLLKGANVGDAFMRNTNYLKWVNINMGDPLYQPFSGGRAPFNGANPQSSLALNPWVTVGSQGSTGTITIASPAPLGGLLLNLTSNLPSVANVPTTVIIQEGATSITFAVSTVGVSATRSMLISASGAGIHLANTLTVAPLLGGLSLLPNRVIGGGPFNAVITLNVPAPDNSAVILPSTSNAGVVVIPDAVPIPQGASEVAFPVSTNPVGASATPWISTLVNGTQAIATVTILPVLSTFSLSAVSAVNGAIVRGTVTLPAPAYSGGITVNLTSSDATIATVPPTVTVAAGLTSATFNISTLAVLNPSPILITASSGASMKQNSLTVNPSAVSSMTLSPTSLVGGKTSTGTVKLNGSAPMGGIIVSLSSDTPSVAANPASVTIPAGLSSITFPITTVPVNSLTPVNVTASYNNAGVSAQLTVNPSVVSTFALVATALVGGKSTSATIRLTGPAPSGGVSVSLTSNTAAVLPPATVNIPGGATSAPFVIATVPVSTSTPTVISATLGVTKTASLAVNPPALLSLSLVPSSLIGGKSSTGTVTLSGLAPATTVTVNLVSNNTAVGFVPAAVTVLGGASTATFLLTTSAVTTNTPVIITATYNGTKTVTLTLNAPTVMSLTLSPTSVVGGTSSTGTITLTGPSPSGGIPVTISSSNFGVAAPPVSAIISGGATAGSFPISTSSVTTKTTPTITTTLGTTKTAVLTVTP